MKKACIAVQLVIAATLLAAEPRETFTVDRFTFVVPEGWKKVAPPSPMRKAQLEIGEGALKAEVIFESTCRYLSELIERSLGATKGNSGIDAS